MRNMRFALLAMVVLCGCNPKPATVFELLPPASIPGAKIQNESAKPFSYGVSIEGDYLNGDNPMSRVFVVYDCLDSEGRKVGEAVAESKRIEAGQTWRYRIFTSERGAVKFRMARAVTEWATTN